MIMIPAAGLAVLLLLTPGTVPNMTDAISEQPRALTLDVTQRDGGIEVQLLGHSAHTQVVSYTLEVTGQSTSRHSGKTTLAAGATSVLSTMRTSAGSEWCVKLVAEETGREPYEVIEGSCAAPEG